MNQATDRHEPSKARIEAIRRWHIDQAIAEDSPIALLAITLTGDDYVITNSVGFESELAPTFLPGLRKLTARVESLVAEKRAELELVRNDDPVPAKAQAKRRRAKVVPLRIV